MQTPPQLVGIAGGVALIALAALLYRRFVKLHPRVSLFKVQPAAEKGIAAPFSAKECR